jgi:hypothetical protein
MSTIVSTLTIDEHGVREWRGPDGKLHRDDGPAIEYQDGAADWFHHGALTKKLYPTGTVVFYRDIADGFEEDERLVVKHRVDGPAVIRWEGLELWFVEDKQIDPVTILGPLGIDYMRWESWTDSEKVAAKLALVG